jgi:hypothetical protein
MGNRGITPAARRSLPLTGVANLRRRETPKPISVCSYTKLGGSGAKPSAAIRSIDGESQELPPDEIMARPYPPIEAVPLYGGLLHVKKRLED